jgi:hypothetical protein
MKTHKPTADEKRIIRDCAKRSADRKGIELQPGTRYHIGGPREVPAGGEINIAFVTDQPDWEDTDLDDFRDWETFSKGFLLTEDGRAIIDFYVYETRGWKELRTNVTAYWENGRMVRVEGTGEGAMWIAGNGGTAGRYLNRNA